MSDIKKSKILIIISSYKTCLKGVGGHYVSAVNYYLSLRKNNVVDFLVLGSAPSASIDSSRISSKFIRLSLRNLLKCYFELSRWIRRGKYNVIITFDEMSFVAARISTFPSKKNKFLSIKPGGGLSSKLYATGENLVIFSAEDSDSLTGKSFQTTLFPNRLYLGKEREIVYKKNHWTTFNGLKILSICRVSRLKKVHFEKCLNLASMLTRSSVDYELILLGAIQDQEYFEEIKKESECFKVAFVTHEKYTSMAAEYVKDCDIALVMGRSVPEAILAGRIVCIPLNSCKFPVFLNSANYDSLKHSNFSYRANCSESYLDENGFIIEYNNAKIEIENKIKNKIQDDFLLCDGDLRLMRIIGNLFARKYYLDVKSMAGMYRLLRLLILEFKYQNAE